jgi:tetratricopeptide (TPR) repeat protein
MDRRYAKAWNNRGVTCVALRRYREAEYCFDQALKVEKENAEVWHNKGKVLEIVGRLDEALTCYDKALELSPKDKETVMDRKLCLQKIEEREKEEESVEA